MNYDLDKVKTELDAEDIINILKHFYPFLEYQNTPFGLILPTICHNEYMEDASMKLYYYENTKLFHCYTECQNSFDIYSLLDKINTNKQLNFSFHQLLNIIINSSKVVLHFHEADELYASIVPKYQKNKTEVKWNFIDPKILNCFSTVKPTEWLVEGIHADAMETFNIRYSVAREQAIIPHYNIDGMLVGIRARNFNLKDMEYGKYMPARIEGEIYSHPLSCNLYGIHKTWPAIDKMKTAWIFEGEKSVLLCEGWYGSNNIAVATCGNKLNKLQLELLSKLGVQNVVLCYDRMNDCSDPNDRYFYNLYDICRTYKNYFNFSFIYDREGILPYKAAPVDCGREIFEHLLKKRVIIR